MQSDQSTAVTEIGQTAPDAIPTKFQKGFKFWAILVVLSLASLLTALEATITSTVLPVVTTDLNAGHNYIWIANAYLLTL